MSNKLNLFLALSMVACLSQTVLSQTKQCKKGSCEVIRKSPSCKTGNCSKKSKPVKQHAHGNRTLKRAKNNCAVACEKRECSGKCSFFKKAPKAAGKAIAAPFKATGKLLKKVFGRKS